MDVSKTSRRSPLKAGRLGPAVARQQPGVARIGQDSGVRNSAGRGRGLPKGGGEAHHQPPMNDISTLGWLGEMVFAARCSE